MTAQKPRSRRPDAGFFRAAWRAMVLGRCPHCGGSKMFRDYLSLHDRCPVCDLRYEAERGAWLGGLALGYTVGATVALLLAMIEMRWHLIAGTGLDPIWTVAVASLASTWPAYRPAKGLWFAMLYHWDFMAFGDDPPGPVAGVGDPAGP